MLTQSVAPTYLKPPLGSDYFSKLRRSEFGRLDRTGHAYLDYTGSALYAERQIRSYTMLLENGVFGNPHSDNGPSEASTTLVEEARHRVLDFFDASPDDYVVCFTANTSAAIKLVAESFPFSGDGCLVLSTDNHNSMNGVREYAARAGARVEYLPLDHELRLIEPLSHLRRYAATGEKLFAYPAQSNFSGVRHPLSLVAAAQAMGYSVLLDAAAFAPSNRLSLRETPADYVAISMYKIFGLPTGVGALIARREALERLRRPWFSGGTVEYASVQNRAHLLRAGEAGFEDGTPSFLDVGALSEGFAFLDEVEMERLNDRVRLLTGVVLERLLSLRCSVRIYGPVNLDQRGGTIAFNVLDRRGRVVPYAVVETAARDAGVAVRGGCFCNPGASEAAFGFPADIAKRCTEEASVRGFTVERFSECLGPEIAVGAVRASVGLATSFSDVNRLMGVVDSLC
jgi:selenocysteine lyase/cysteine desulfurase